MGKVEQEKKGITVAEMRDLCAEACKQGKGHNVLRVPIERGTTSIGSSHSVNIVTAEAGFDHNARSFFLNPSEPVAVGDAKLQILKKRTHRAHETIYWLSSILRDTKSTPEQKLEMMAMRLANYTNKEPEHQE